MKTIKSVILFFGVVLVLGFNSGCATYLAKSSWAEARQKQAVKIDADGNRVLVGVDLTNLAYLKDNWPKALGAGIIDAGLIYSAYYMYEEINDSGSSRNKRPNQNIGRDSTSVSLTGDGNTVLIRGDESSFGGGNQGSGDL